MIGCYQMYSIANRLPFRLKKQIISYFLKKNNINFNGIPKITGHWPNIENYGEMTIGVNCTFQSFRLPLSFTVFQNAKLEIGHVSGFNDGVNLCAKQYIKIGNDVKVGDMTYIYDTSFHQVSPIAPMKCKAVIIGNNVWIGAKSMILAGSVIGDHSVVAAGSIVTGEIPPKSMVAGAPAKVIKTLDIPDDWVRD